jgi:16S rRNA (guanine966-N2)-methyltransferase
MKIVGGKFKGRNLIAPKTATTRPTQGALREAVFNICQSEIVSAYFLDLFAGSGAMGFEALSRGAAHVTFVENNKIALDTIRKNIELFNLGEQITIIPLDASRAIEKLTKPFDIVI